MRRLLALALSIGLLATSVATVAAHDTGRKTSTATAKAPSLLKVTATRNVVQGGRVKLTAIVVHCDRSSYTGAVITATSDLTGGTIAFKRAGMTQNSGSSSRSCVWQASFRVSATAQPGKHTVTIASSIPTRNANGGAMVATATTRLSVTVTAPDSSSGTGHGDHSSGTDHSSGSSHKS